ncbi:MAG: hypothetical protein WAU91_03580, partial [Desulfatitalea sp.]
MAYNLGLNVVEVDGRVAPSIQAAPTSVAALIVRSPRGLPGQVYRVTNWTEYVEHFGGFMAGAYGAFAMRGFLDNGGTVAYVTRVVNMTPGGAMAASMTSAAGPWALTPGGTLRFTSNVAAAPMDVQFTATSASLAGSAGPFNLDDGAGAGLQLVLTVNGVASGPYQFLGADFADLTAATADEVAAVLNREFPGIQAWVDGGTLRVRTDRRGAGAGLQASGSAAAPLALDDDGLQRGGGNVADIQAVTPAEALAVINAVLAPQGLIVSQSNGRITITHPTTGVAAVIQIVATATSVHAALGWDTVAHTGTDGDPTVAAAAATRAFVNGGAAALTVTAGYRGTADPGAWGEQLAMRIAPNAQRAGTYDLTVRSNGTVVETWEGLNNSTAAGAPGRHPVAAINNEFTGSKFIRVTENATANPAPTAAHAAADADGFVALESGRDDTLSGAALDNAFAAALDRFDVYQVQLVCCPESSNAAWVSAALTQCASRGDCMLVGHTPVGYDAAASKTYGQTFQGEKVYGALYFPWIRVANPIDPVAPMWIPPSGHIMGVYARTERERGIWKAPAGNAAKLNNALEVQYQITDAVHTDLVKNGSVNAVRYLPGLGNVIDSSRTLSTSTIWLYVG